MADPDVVRRRALKSAISIIVNGAGFRQIEEICLDSMLEMVQSFIIELGRSTKALSEHAGRTEPLLDDVLLAMTEQGIDTKSIQDQRKIRYKKSVPPLTQAREPMQPRIMSTGDKPSHPVYIPTHFPQFPDPHTYIQTPTTQQPMTRYQVIREKAACQRRDVEKALTRFIAKTGPKHRLFPDDHSQFPLIACEPKPLVCLKALLTLEEQASAEESEETDSSKQPSAQDDVNKALVSAESTLGTKREQNVDNKTFLSQRTYHDQDIAIGIDNPYLRPVKRPRTFKKKFGPKIYFTADP